MLTTNLADGGGTVHCRPNQFPALNMRHKMELATASINLDKRVLLPPKTWWQEESLADRFARAKAAAAELGLNRIEYAAATRQPVGFVASGLAYGYLVQSLARDGPARAQWPILKLGMSYPVDERLVGELAQQCERIVVVEERRSFLEEQIHQIMTAQTPAGPARRRRSRCGASNCRAA